MVVFLQADCPANHSAMEGGLDKLRQLAEVFAQHSKKLYFVGGSVRDMLLGRSSLDYDCATDALPEETKHLARLVHPDGMYTVGEKFGTVGLILGDCKVEITTFRAEQYNPESRKPEVTFGTSLEDDLARRDFTINAIAQDALTGAIIDPFGGRRDLAAKLVRAVGNPQERFEEDPLRMLRGVRLCVELGFSLDHATAEAIRRSVTSLRRISKERIAEEMNRILLSPQPARGLRMLADLGLLDEIVPEVAALRGTLNAIGRHKDVFEHTLLVVQRTPPEKALRWAALLHDIAKPRTIVYEDGEIHFPGHEVIGEPMARAVLSRLRFDSQTIEKVGRLVGMHMRINQYSEDWTDGAVRRLVREAGDDLPDLFALSRADITSQRPSRVRAALSRIDELDHRVAELEKQASIAALKSPLDGNELMAIFQRPPGPWIKPIKEYLLSLVLEGSLAPDDKARAEELAREFVARHENQLGQDHPPTSSPGP